MSGNASGEVNVKGDAHRDDPSYQYIPIEGDTGTLRRLGTDAESRREKVVGEDDRSDGGEDRAVDSHES